MEKERYRYIEREIERARERETEWREEGDGFETSDFLCLLSARAPGC